MFFNTEVEEPKTLDDEIAEYSEKICGEKDKEKIQEILREFFEESYSYIAPRG